MKSDEFSRSPIPLSGSQPMAPTPAQVAKRAYFNYLNHGSVPGHEVKHWVEAEAQLFAEISRGAHVHWGL